MPLSVKGGPKPAAKIKATGKGAATITKETVEHNEGGGSTTVGHEAATDQVEMPGTEPATVLPPCEVEVGMGNTIPTKPFASVRLNVALRIPCTHAEIEPVYEFAAEWCNSKLNELSAMVQAENDGAGG